MSTDTLVPIEDIIAQPVKTITTEEQAQQARYYRELLRDFTDAVDAEYGPMEEKARAALAQIREQHKAARSPAEAADAKLVAALEAYETAKLRHATEVREQLAAAVQAAQDEVITAQAEKLIAQGSTDEAIELVSNPPAMPLPEIRLAPKGTHVLHDFKITDEAAIRREYLQPNEKKIRAAVRKYQSKAPDIVGGIEYIPRARPRRKARPKTS